MFAADFAILVAVAVVETCFRRLRVISTATSNPDNERPLKSKKFGSSLVSAGLCSGVFYEASPVKPMQPIHHLRRWKGAPR